MRTLTQFDGLIVISGVRSALYLAGLAVESIPLW